MPGTFTGKTGRCLSYLVFSNNFVFYISKNIFSSVLLIAKGYELKE